MAQTQHWTFLEVLDLALETFGRLTEPNLAN